MYMECCFIAAFYVAMYVINIILLHIASASGIPPIISTIYFVYFSGHKYMLTFWEITLNNRIHFRYIFMFVLFNIFCIINIKFM